jgi:hypothetical protein
MSQARITLPIILDDIVPLPARLEPINRREYLRNPDAAKFRFEDVAGRPRGEPIDPWRLRDSFLLWPLEDWQRFFEVAGEGGFGSVTGKTMTKDDFADWQQLLRAALIRPAKEWNALSHEFGLKGIELLFAVPIHFAWDGAVPSAKISAPSALRAMIATIQVEKLQGATFRECARPDCKNPPFKVEARHKIFCSSDCAHLVAVRNSRKRAEERVERRKR